MSLSEKQALASDLADAMDATGAQVLASFDHEYGTPQHAECDKKARLYRLRYEDLLGDWETAYPGQAWPDFLPAEDDERAS